MGRERGATPHMSTFALLAAVLGGSVLPDLQPHAEAPFDLGRVASVVLDDHARPRALGPDWESEFTEAGARFLPVLGDAAPRAQDLTLAATRISRGDAALDLFAADPGILDEHVVYRRAPGVEERFTATLQGLEHSLWIEAPVGERGDLVVHIDLGGELSAFGARLPDGTHRFDRGLGGVHYGDLVAIDAAGRRSKGDVQLVPGGLTWTVPADFVDSATWPLLLDPLIGSAFVISTADGNSADRESDVAYDASNDLYLAVWQRTISGGDRSIRGQRFSAQGTPLGAMLAISTNTTSRSPKVANVNLSNRFAVTWTQSVGAENQVRVRAVAASDGVQSNNLLVRATSAGPIQGADIAGESLTTTSPHAWVVYGDWPEAILGTRIQVPATGNITVVQGFAIEGSPARFPKISSAPDANGRMAVMWRSESVQGLHQLRATTFSRDGNLFHAPQTVWTAVQTLGGYALDGGRGADGVSQYALAIETRDLFPNTSYQLRLRTMRSGGFGNQLTFGPAELYVENDPETTSPSVAWRGDKAYVAYVRNGGKSISLLGVNPANCLPCDLQTVVTTTSSTIFFRDPCVVLNASGAGPASLDSRGVVAWSQQSTSLIPTPSTTVRARFLDAVSPLAQSQDLAGGCGSAGTHLVNSPPALGNGAFRAQLHSPALGSLFAIYNIAPPSVPLACGPCQWVPFSTTFLVPIVGDASLVEFALPIPCTPAFAGAVLDTQWTVYRPGAQPCAALMDFEVSSILRLVVQ